MCEWCDHKAIINLTDPSNFYVGVISQGQLHELVSCTCITLLKLNKPKRDLEINS